MVLIFECGAYFRECLLTASTVVIGVLEMTLKLVVVVVVVVVLYQELLSRLALAML